MRCWGSHAFSAGWRLGPDFWSSVWTLRDQSWSCVLENQSRSSLLWVVLVVRHLTKPFALWHLQQDQDWSQEPALVRMTGLHQVHRPSPNRYGSVHHALPSWSRSRGLGQLCRSNAVGSTVCCEYAHVPKGQELVWLKDRKVMAVSIVQLDVNAIDVVLRDAGLSYDVTCQVRPNWSIDCHM